MFDVKRLTPAQHEQFARHCLPKIQGVLDKYPAPPPVDPNAKGFPGQATLAQILLTLVMQYGPQVAQEVMNLIVAELQQWSANPTPPPTGS